MHLAAPRRRPGDAPLHRALRVRRGRQFRDADPSSRPTADWTRSYAYNEASLIEPAKKNNRLSSTTSAQRQPTTVEPYTHDAHGNMTAMPHLPLMEWDFHDQLAGDVEAGGQQRHAGDDLLRLRRRRPARAQGHRAAATARRQRTSASISAASRSTASTAAVEPRDAGARDAARHGRQAAHRAGGDAHAG